MTRGLVIDFGTATITGQGAGGNSTFNDIHVDGRSRGGPFTTAAFFFQNVWQSKCSGLSGDANDTGGGDFWQFAGCVNLVISDIQFQGFNYGIRIFAATGSLSDCQGLNFTNIRSVQCQHSIDARFTTNGGFFLTNFMLDNADNPLPAGQVLSLNVP